MVSYLVHCTSALFAVLVPVHPRTIKPFYRDVTHMRKDTLPPAFPYWKRRKAGRGLGTRLHASINSSRMPSGPQKLERPIITQVYEQKTVIYNVCSDSPLIMYCSSRNISLYNVFFTVRNSNSAWPTAVAQHTLR